MCGRFSLTTAFELLAEAFGLDQAVELAPRYNIAPSQPIAVVRRDGDRRRLGLLRWGLVPAWAGPAGPRPQINARSETAARLPTFRDALSARRCLVPADAFYEWRREVGSRSRQPFQIQMKDGGLFAFAGIWEPSHEEEAALPTCAILTTEPNPLVREIHDRMPVILPPADYDRWLDPATRSAAALRSLLRPFPAEAMTAHAVGRAVNDPRHDGPDCAEPVPAQKRLFNDDSGT
jgi:putative SOS response-associated peptidase YedK